MLEGWLRERPPAPAANAPPAGVPGPLAVPPRAPPSGTTSPFLPNPTTPPAPVPNATTPPAPVPPPPPVPVPNPPATPSNGPEPPAAAPSTGNSGQPSAVLTPRSSRSMVSPRSAPRLVNVSAGSGRNAEARPPQVAADRKDPGVLRAAFQASGSATTTGPASGTAGAATTRPSTPGPNIIDTEPHPGFEVDIKQGPDIRTGRPTATLTQLLSPTSATIDDAQAAALPSSGPIYVINPAQALTLALINSRAYQSQIEAVYVSSLNLTLQRFAFQPQFIAGLSPLTGVGGAGSTVGRPSVPSPNFTNSFLYRTNEVVGGQQSTLNIGELAGFGKLLSFGGNILGGFANQTVFNFIGKNPIQPTVQSVLPITLIQPFLRGGGRAVTLEPLTQAERSLLYQVRVLARFRQQFMPYVLTSASQPADGGGAGAAGGAVGGAAAGGNALDAGIGYLNVLQQIQVVENNRKTVAAFEALVAAYVEMAKGAGAGVSALNVEQINSSLQNSRSTLIVAITSFRVALDQFKSSSACRPIPRSCWTAGCCSGSAASSTGSTSGSRTRTAIPRSCPRSSTGCRPSRTSSWTAARWSPWARM